MLNEPLILIMRTDPDPNEIRAIFNRKGSIVEANSGRPQLANLLEMQRWVAAIGLQEFKVLSRHLLDLLGEVSKGGPETGSGAMLHRFLRVPLAFSSSASRTRKSSLPAFE